MFILQFVKSHVLRIILQFKCPICPYKGEQDRVPVLEGSTLSENRMYPQNSRTTTAGKGNPEIQTLVLLTDNLKVVQNTKAVLEDRPTDTEKSQKNPGT